MLHTYFSW